MRGQRDCGYPQVIRPHRQLPERLDRVGMEANPPRTADGGELLNRLDGAGLVVRMHDRHKHGIRAHRRIQILGIHTAEAVHRQNRQVESFVVLEAFTGMEHSMMLYSARDDMPSSWR